MVVKAIATPTGLSLDGRRMTPVHAWACDLLAIRAGLPGLAPRARGITSGVRRISPAASR